MPLLCSALPMAPASEPHWLVIATGACYTPSRFIRAGLTVSMVLRCTGRTAGCSLRTHTPVRGDDT
jgi:hypothetical protein